MSRPSLLAWSVAWAVAGAGLAAAVVGLLLALQVDGPTPWKLLVIPVVWAVPGALIAGARPRAALGWLVLAVAVLFSASGLSQMLVRAAGSVEAPVIAWAVWYGERFSAVIVPVTTLALLLLPDSRLPGRRWRVPAVLGVGGQVVLVAMWSFSAGPAGDPDSPWATAAAGIDNPVGVLPGSFGEAASGAVWLLQLPLLLCLAAMVVRVRRAAGPDRRRLVTLLLALAVLVLAILAGRTLWAPVADVVDVLASAFLGVVLVGTVLRRHVDEVAVAVHRVFVLTVLGALIVLAYVAGVAALAAAGPAVSRFGAGVVAATVALAVAPLRARLQRGVDRLLYGDRRDPYQALTRLAEHAHSAPSLARVLDGVAASVATSLRVPSVRVEAFGSQARSGRDLPDGRTGAVRVGLVAGEREIGSITVAPPTGRRLRRDEERLLTELGRHAGLAVDSVRLAADVAAHHRLVVSAREEERRRLGRELHDELGPTVAGLAMQLGALRPLVRSDPDTVVERLSRLERSATAALGDIRRVAHALRPPVLDQVGLGPALLQVAESLDLSVVESVFDHEQLPAAVELAAYRIAAEALTNVARHANVRAVRLAVRATGGVLVLTVEDQGVGLRDAGAAPGGLGLSTMRERAEELGGTFSVGEGQGGGALVTAVVPLEPESVSASVPGAPR